MATRRKSRKSKQLQVEEDPDIKLAAAEEEIAQLRAELKKQRQKNLTVEPTFQLNLEPTDEVDKNNDNEEVNQSSSAPVTMQSKTDMQTSPQSLQSSIDFIQPASMPTRFPQSTSNFRAPPPRQVEFDGKRPWKSFIKPFKELTDACNWSEGETRFRLLNSLRDEAAEYAYSVLPQEVLNSLQLLERALEDRFGEKYSPNTYLAALEQRKLGLKESLAEYSADIKRLVLKGYQTADAITREIIGLRYFIKGLSDQQMTIAVGMRNPTTIDEAKEAVETFLTLRDEMGKPQNRVRAIQPAVEAPGAGNTNIKDNTTEPYITESQFKELLETLDKRFQGISKLVKGSQSGFRNKPGNISNREDRKKDFRCYNCDEEGHIARNCPKQGRNGNGEPKAIDKSEN